jgi:hypothetical protein
MDSERVVVLLERIAESADKAVFGIDRLVAAIPKQAGRMRRALDIVVTVVTILGLLSVVDIFGKWVGG